jgi:single-stranded-DNA-specific exonuclease
MEAASAVYKEYGGHAASGGFTVHEDQVFFLEERLCEALATLGDVAADAVTAEADASVSTEEAGNRLLGSLEKFAPFGMNNPKPVFYFKQVLIQDVSWFGKAEEHLRVRIAHEKGGTLEAISFFARRDLGADADKLSNGARTDVLANLERDQFSRGTPVRLRIVAIR